MSVLRVVIETADERFAPPGHEVEVTVVNETVFISVYEGSDENKPSTKKLAYEVPALNLHDLMTALGAFNPIVSYTSITVDKKEGGS